MTDSPPSTFGRFSICLAVFSLACGYGALLPPSLGDRGGITVQAQNVPGWQKVAFREVEVWLPPNFVGGNPKRDRAMLVKEMRKLKLDAFATEFQTSEIDYQLYCFEKVVNRIGGVTNLIVDGSEVRYGMKMENYIAARLSYLYKSGFDIVESKPISFKNYPTAYLAIAELEVDRDRAASIVVYALKTDSKIWTLIFSVDSLQRKERLPLFQKIANTFRVR